MANNQFHDSDHPLFQTTDTFQQLINDLNHFGNIVDSDMKYLDSALGPETSGYLGKLRGLDDFTANTVTDALNELDSDLHGVGGGNFKADTNTAYKTVTDAINEIERVFDASSGEILYPTGDVTETENRLLISTAQSGGQRIELRAGHNIFLDAVNDVIIDAGGANITFKDDSAIRFDFQMGANQEIDVPTGNLTVDVAGDITLDAGGADIDMQVATVSRVKHSLGATNTVTVNGNYTVDVAGNVVIDTSTGSLSLKDDGANAIVYSLDPAGTNTATVTGNLTYDVSGDITLDANGDDFIFKDGTTERFRLNADAAPNMTITGTAASITNTAGDFTINAYQSFVLNTNAGTKSWDIDTDTITHTGDAILDVSGDIALDAGSGVFYYKWDGATQVTRTLSSLTVDSVVGDYTISTDGALVLQVADSASGISFKRGNNTRYQYFFGPDNKLEITGGYHIDVSGDMIIDTYSGNLYFYRDSDQVITWDLDSAITHMDVVRTLRISTQTGGITIDADSDIRLCTHTGHIHFQADSVAHSTEYATFTNNNGDVVFYTGVYTAGQEVYRTDSADINFARAIGLPTSGAATPHTNAKTVHGALAEVNARIPNVYDRNGTLLNA